ncbi:short chain dehydrogenase reductase [Klebsormidium nitens]|uniref:Short chain dehydrogenase reductase n=1 Tax=Klebsormidium nitens TaxID=105231 RepID=A0A1Y1HR67_KLENI|nr:short chain dehydrogenase reductase [Klebsormidium nitens]|eukprot:GAQ81135.1 short chain dehydrogenase reductase [Klebsormidium nitens]
MASNLLGDLANLLFTFVLYPLGILNLLWLAPLVAIWRSTWYLLKPKTKVKGKVVVVTGASSGIGEHIAFEFAKLGAKLVLAARREDRLQSVAEICQQLGSPNVEVVQADVRKEDDCKKIIDHAIQKFDRLDILVNNAGVAHLFLASAAPNFSLESAKEVMDTTFWGHVHATHYALPHLKATNGQLLNIVSVASYIPYPRQAFYNAAKQAALGFFDTLSHRRAALFAAKHAALGFFDTLRAEAGSRITVTNVLPGWVASEMTEGKLLNTDDKPAWDTGLRDEHVGPWPVLPTTDLAKLAVHTALKRERNVIVPLWYTLFLYFRVLAPEALDWSFQLLFASSEPGKSAPTKKMVQMVGTETLNMPPPGTQERATEAFKENLKNRAWDGNHKKSENGKQENGKQENGQQNGQKKEQ